MTTKQFKELCDGWGIEEVPKELRKQLCCCICLQNDTGRGKLYTARGGNLQYGTLKELNKLLSEIREHCYCRWHVERYYGE